MEENGLPTFIAVIASAIIVIGVVIALSVVTWAILLAG
jgi:hypothetical protein